MKLAAGDLILYSASSLQHVTPVISGELGEMHASVVALTGTYHNLLRMWAEV